MHGWVEKIFVIVVVGYLAAKLVYPLLDATVGKFIPRLA